MGKPLPGRDTIAHMAKLQVAVAVDMPGHEYTAELLNIIARFSCYNIHYCSPFIGNQQMGMIKKLVSCKQMIRLKFAIRHS
jgi:hypothetical protein